MPTLRLTEWLPAPPTAVAVEARQLLERVFSARITTAGPDEYVVTPAGIIGTIRAGDTAITVSPRFGIDRVLFMVAYANDPYRWRGTLSGLGTVDSLVDGMAALFIRSCNALLAQGLLRTYRREEADATVVRGRVRWERQARRIAPVPIALRFDVHDDDIVENRIIREAVTALRPLIQGSSAADQLARLWRLVSHLTPLRQPLVAADRIVWGRRNDHYRPMIDLAKIILAGRMLDVADGSASVEGFTLTMHDVFERFVRRALSQAMGSAVGDGWTIRGFTLDESGAFPLRPDLVVRSGDVWRFVGDAKYKPDADNHNADVYQALSYAVAAGLPEAHLIYAAGPQAQSSHAIRHLDIRIHVHRLDLTLQPDEVVRRVAQIARLEQEGASRGRSLPI